MEASSAVLPQAVFTGYETAQTAAAAAAVLPDLPVGHAAVGSGMYLPGPGPSGAALPTATPLTPLQALQQGNLGVGFSGTGYLLMYFVGVTSILRSLGIINSNTRVAGASGGSIASAVMCSNMSNTQFASMTKSLSTTCAGTNCQHNLDFVARAGLGNYLPADVATRCQGHLFAAVTIANPNPTTDTGVLVQNFTNKGQVIGALAASCYIPGFSGLTATIDPGNIVTPSGVRITAAYDGALTNPMPAPPLAGPGYVITVSALANGTNPPNFDWVAGSLAPLNPVKQPQPARVDIYPGLGGALRFSNATWNSFALTAPSIDLLQYLYDVGRADAAAWCTQQGMETAAAINTAKTRTAHNIATLGFSNLVTG